MTLALLTVIQIALHVPDIPLPPGRSLAPTAFDGSGLPSTLRDDATILGIIEYAHTAGLESADIGLRHGGAPEVKELARSFSTAHTHARDEVRALGIRLQLRPLLPDGDPLARSHAETVTRLQGLGGRAFDLAWADHQVDFHRRLIERVKSGLLPGTADQEVKGYLNRLIPALLVHLDEAVALQSRLITFQGGSRSGT